MFMPRKKDQNNVVRGLVGRASLDAMEAEKEENTGWVVFITAISMYILDHSLSSHILW